MSWRPDWRDEKQYPDPATTEPRVWSWEFLRRNEEYQFDWMVYLETDRQFLDEMTQWGIRADRRLATKWNISGMFDYRLSCDSSFDINFRENGPMFFGDFATVIKVTPNLPSERLQDPNLLWFAFDSTFPVSEQLAWAERIIEANTPPEPSKLRPADREAYLERLANKTPSKPKKKNVQKKSNYTPNMYSRYLRILDADFNDVKHKEIATMLLSDSKDPESALAKNLKKARELVANGYRLITALKI